MDFVSVTNMKYIVGILQDYFTEKYSIDLTKVALQINLKALVHAEMVRASKMGGTSVTEKNKEVFKQCITIVLNAVQGLRQQAGGEQQQQQHHSQMPAEQQYPFHQQIVVDQQQYPPFQQHYDPAPLSNAMMMMATPPPGEQQHPSFLAMASASAQLEPLPSSTDYNVMVRDIQKQREESMPPAKKTLTYAVSAKDPIVPFRVFTIESVVIVERDILFLRHSSGTGNINTPFGNMVCVLDATGKVTYGGEVTESGTLMGITKIGGEVDLSDVPCFVWV